MDSPPRRRHTTSLRRISQVGDASCDVVSSLVSMIIVLAASVSSVSLSIGITIPSSMMMTAPTSHIIFVISESLDKVEDILSKRYEHHTLLA